MATALIVADFPKVGDFRFTEVTDPTPANYLVGGSIGFDQKQYSEMTMFWQTPTTYMQKRTFNDYCTVYVQTNAVGSTPVWPTLTISNGSVGYAILPATFGIGYQRVPGNYYTDPITGTQTQLDTFFWKFQMGALLDPDTESGCWTMTMRVYGDAGLTIYRDYQSEPILVYAEQPGTVLIEAQNNTNRTSQSVIAAGWTGDIVPTFQQRVEAQILEYMPKGLYVGFLEQNYLQAQLNAQNFRTFKFYLGDVSPGVPAYMFEKVSELFITDLWKINGKYYTLDADNRNSVAVMWENQDPQASNLVWPNIAIRERFVAQNVFVNETPTPDLLIFEWTGYPFAIPEWILSTGFSSLPATFDIIDDTGDADDYLTYLLSLATGFYRSGDAIYYTPEPGYIPEIYGGSVELLYDMFTLLQTSGGSRTMGYRYAGVGNKQVIDFGDGSAYEYYNNLDALSYDVTHTFIDAAPTATVRVFHNSFIGNLQFREDGSYYPSTSALLQIGGVLPRNNDTTGTTGLQFLEINNCDSFASNTSNIANLDISMCTNIVTLILANCAAVQDFGNLFENGTPPANPILSVLVLSGNPLTSTAVDDVFINFVANIWNGTLASGSIQVTCSPSQAPTAASSTERTALTTASWTLTTD